MEIRKKWHKKIHIFEKENQIKLRYLSEFIRYTIFFVYKRVNRNHI